MIPNHMELYVDFLVEQRHKRDAEKSRQKLFNENDESFSIWNDDVLLGSRQEEDCENADTNALSIPEHKTSSCLEQEHKRTQEKMDAYHQIRRALQIFGKASVYLALEKSYLAAYVFLCSNKQTKHCVDDESWRLWNEFRSTKDSMEPYFTLEACVAYACKDWWECVRYRASVFGFKNCSTELNIRVRCFACGSKISKLVSCKRCRVTFYCFFCEILDAQRHKSLCGKILKQ